MQNVWGVGVWGLGLIGCLEASLGFRVQCALPLTLNAMYFGLRV